jgi:protein TonB
MNNKAFLLSVAVLFSMYILAGCALSEPSQQPIFGNEAPFSLVIVPEEGAEDEPEVFIIVDQMPEMIGGQEALYEALRYPPEAVEAETEGRVIIQFIVSKEGVPEDISVVRSVSEPLDKAGVAAIKQMRFTPGIQNEKPVKVMLTQPIIFSL